MQGVCRTTAAAIQFCPAILALRFGIAVDFLELALQFRFGHAIPDVAQAEFFIADELVAREQFAPRCDSHIFRS